MNDTTSIKYEKVQGHAATVKGCATTMNDLFDQFTAIMNDLARAEVFTGQASEALQAEFAKLKSKLVTYYEKVEDFADVITYTGDTTQTMEQRLAQAASDITNL